jgi:hypothetical protein
MVNCPILSPHIPFIQAGLYLFGCATACAGLKAWLNLVDGAYLHWLPGVAHYLRTNIDSGVVRLLIDVLLRAITNETSALPLSSSFI